jgi:NhaP-type Na+/H+ or K+/H+ antiporter
MLGLHDLGAGGWRWLAVDVLWGIFGGLALGAALGLVVGKLVVYLRVHHQEAVGLNEFLALGLIALAYGVTVLVHALGFLAVFAAGLALRRIEKQPDDTAGLHEAVQQASASAEVKMDAEDAVATHPRHATAHMTHAVLGFDEQLEHIVEIAVVLIVGGMLWYTYLPHAMLWFAPVLFLLIRPVSVWLGLLGSRSTADQRGLISWFGIRGIGSIYYLMYAINHGLPRALADELVAITLVVVTTSIVVHGISVTPLMLLYARRNRRLKKSR